MAALQPLKIFSMIVILIIGFLLALVLLLISNALVTEISSNDLDRYAAEAGEILSNSPSLTKSKYVFEKAKLDAVKGNMISVGHQCEFDYKAVLTDLLTGEEWEFGYEPSSALDSNELDKAEKTFSVAIYVPPARDGDFYGTVNQAKLTLIAYDSVFTRITCMVEKSFVQKEVLDLTLDTCPKTSYDIWECFSLRRAGNDRACYFTKADNGATKDVECRYMSSEIKFEETFIRLTQSQFPGKKIIKTYPLTTAGDTCDAVKNSGNIAGKADKIVETVLICMEQAK